MHLTSVLVIGATVIALLVLAIYVIAVRTPEGKLDHVGGMRLVLWLGAIFPTVVLTALLLWALPAMRPLPHQSGDLRIQVQGEQFWWRLRYEDGNGPGVISANEVRVPVGRTVVFDVTATDVVHSFWIPGLGGKMDMIPGRINRLVVKADKPGIFRGVCAEFCGLSHALMAFDVIAMEPSAFDAWLASARGVPGRADGGGAELFSANGCGACHTVKGTPHTAMIGPDLTRLGERRSLAAGTLPPTLESTAAFIRDASRFKPGARMPAYSAMPIEDATEIARWLRSADGEAGR